MSSQFQCKSDVALYDIVALGLSQYIIIIC